MSYDNFSSLNDILNKVLKNAPRSEGDSVWQFWPEIVGSRVASFAKPVQFRAGVLVIATANPMWTTELQYRIAEIRDKLNQKLPPNEQITKIVLRTKSR